MKQKIIKITSFIVCSALFFTIAAKALSFKYLDSTFKVDSYYELEENTVEVLALGSSHMYQGLNTAVLWTEFGIPAFNFCGAAQPIWNTYFYLEEALKTQTPKVILLDTYYLHLSGDYSEKSFAIKNTYALRDNEIKEEAISESFEMEEGDYQYYIEPLQYHSRYSDLSKSDFYPYLANEEMYKHHKGFYCYFKTAAVAETDLTKFDEYSLLTEKTEKYYRKIFELAKEKSIPVVPIAIPHLAEEYHQKYYNTGALIAAEYGCEYLNFLTDYKEALGLDYNNDFADNQHLNHNGNTKLTRFLGDYLKEKYDLKNHRDDDKYYSWEYDAAVYYKQLLNHKITKSKDLFSIIDEIRDNNYCIIININHDEFERSNGEKSSLPIYLRILGFKNEDLLKCGTWIINEGKIVYRCSDKKTDGFKNYDVNKFDTIRISYSTSLNSQDEFSYKTDIFINDKNVTKTQNGANIVIYDNLTKTFVRTFGFDLKNNELI